MTENNIVQFESKPSNYYKDYETFYTAYYKKVIGYLKNRVNSFADAEDIAGKVFLYCYEKWDTYDPSKASQSTWLFMIVRSRWTDFLRSNRSYVDIEKLDEVLTDGEDQIENATRLEAIRQELAVSLGKLPDNQKTAVIMRYFGEYSDDEIALHLNTTAGNVRVIIHRGLNRLRSEASFKELLQYQ